MSEQEKMNENTQNHNVICEKGKRKVKVIIVGAGVAGLSSARFLADINRNNNSNVEFEITILEARFV